APALAENVALMRQMGVPTEALDAQGVVLAQPFLSPEGIGAAAWEPESGFADPGDSIGSLLAGLRARGGQVRLETGPARLVMAPVTRTPSASRPGPRRATSRLRLQPARNWSPARRGSCHACPTWSGPCPGGPGWASTRARQTGMPSPDRCPASRACTC